MPAPETPRPETPVSETPTSEVPTSETPTVSVVIPAYNAADLLPDTVESVLAQTYPAVEVIVVDDGSTDNTPDVMEAYTPAVRYIRKENGGSASARNRGIREATGTYIALLDADDLWRPTKLTQQVAQLQAHPDLRWSYTNWLHADAQTGETLYRADQVMPQPDGDVLRPLVGRLFIPPSTELIRRDVFDAVGLYDESRLHRISEDWELSLRIAERYPVGYIAEPLVVRRRHAGKKTSTMNLDHALESRRAIIEKAIRRNPDRLADRRDAALANLYTKIGRKWLNREERRRARALFVRALQHAPTDRRAWTYGLATFLPRPMLRVLGRLRAAFWEVMRRVSSAAEGTASEHAEETETSSAMRVPPADARL